MIFQDIDAQIAALFDQMDDEEAVKDTLFKNMVGYGRDTSMSDLESLESCQEYRRKYPQPAIFGMSNDRGFTYSAAIPTHYDWDEAQSSSVRTLREKHFSVVVTDAEIEEFRLQSRNTLTQGDVVAVLVREKIAGLATEAPEGASSQGYQALQGFVLEAVYCKTSRSTHYFVG